MFNVAEIILKLFYNFKIILFHMYNHGLTISLLKDMETKVQLQVDVWTRVTQICNFTPVVTLHVVAKPAITVVRQL